MSSLVPDAALTHVAIDEVLQLLLLSGGGKGSGTGGLGDGSGKVGVDGPCSSTGSLPGGMRAWIAGSLMVVAAAGTAPH